jgi:CRISPR/Cas system-associated exonuclease Cas4 (RecB family)
MLMLPGDPERSPRDADRRKNGTHDAYLLKNKSKPEDFKDTIYDLLVDDKIRSFNEISVHILDKNACISCGSPFEEALWQLVDDKYVKWALLDDGSEGIKAIVFKRWPEGESLHPGCEECRRMDYPLEGPWSFSRVTECSQASLWGRVDGDILEEPDGRPDDVFNTDRTNVGHAKHTGAEIMLDGLKKKGRWPSPPKVARHLMKMPEYTHLPGESVLDITTSMELFTEKFEFDMDMRLGAEVEYGLDTNEESINFWDTPKKGWRSRIDWAQFDKWLEITDYKNRPAMFTPGELKQDLQLSLYAWIISRWHPVVREVEKVVLRIYYFEFGVHQKVEVTWDVIDENVKKLFAMAEKKETTKREEIQPEPGWGKCQYCPFLMDCEPGFELMNKDAATIDGITKLAKWLFVTEEKVSSTRAAITKFTAEHGPIMLDEDSGYGHAIGENKTKDVKAIFTAAKGLGVNPFDFLSIDSKKLDKLTKGNDAFKTEVDKHIEVTEKTKFQAFRAKKKKAIKVEKKNVKARVKGKGRKDEE